MVDAKRENEREIDEALRKQHEAWREEQELMRMGYEERAEEDLAMIREFDGTKRITELEARIEQLGEALEHSRNERVRLETWLVAMRDFVPDDIHYADMAYKGAVERALSGEHLKKEGGEV